MLGRWRRRDSRLRPIARELGAGPYAHTANVPRDVDLDKAIDDHDELRSRRARRELLEPPGSPAGAAA